MHGSKSNNYYNSALNRIMYVLAPDARNENGPDCNLKKKA